MRKSHILALLIATLCLSTAFAATGNIKTEQGSVETLINPFIDITRQQGLSRLAGRYAHAKAIPSRAGGGSIMAPTSLIMQINTDGTGTVDIAGDAPVPIQVTLNVQASVPTLTTAYANEPGESPMTDYAVLVPQGSRSMWRLLGTSSGNLRHMVPLTGDWFPAGYLEGAWQGDDGSQIVFQNGQLSSNGQPLGTYTTSDNRVYVTMTNGGSDLLFTAYDPDAGLLVLTFNGAEPQNWNAMTYRRASQQTAPQPLPQPTPQPQPAPQPMPQPQPFPPLPVPPQQPQISLDGVWGAVLPNGVQAVIQIQGNQYWGWLNGMPSESGVFQIQGNVMRGQTSTGTMFQNQFQCDGRTLTMAFQNGSVVVYQRMR